MLLSLISSDLSFSDKGHHFPFTSRSNVTTDTSAAVLHSPELLAFAQRQVKLDGDQVQPSPERRGLYRAPFAVPAVAQTVDENLKPLGNPIAAATRDMTRIGLGLIFECELSIGDLLAVCFSVDGKEVCVLVEALWCKPMAPFHYVGFRAVRSLDNMPCTETDAYSHHDRQN